MAAKKKKASAAAYQQEEAGQEEDRERSTFLIGPDGRVVEAWCGVRVPGHVEAVLTRLRD